MERANVKLHIDGIPGRGDAVSLLGSLQAETPVLIDYLPLGIRFKNDAGGLWPYVEVVGEPGESARLVVARWLVAVMEKMEGG